MITRMKQTEFSNRTSKERGIPAHRGDMRTGSRHFLASRLISAGVFSHCNVLAKNDGVSMSTIGPQPAGQNGAIAFATTRWSLVLTAQSKSPAAREALEKLCCAYWRPLYAFVRQQGYKHEEAEDLTQGFFAVLLERNGLDTLHKEKGRVRSFLLVSLKNFLADEHRRALRIKRGKGQALIPLEELRNGEVDVEPSDSLTAERIYDRRWASTLLDHVFAKLKDDYFKAGNAELFDCLKQLLAEGPEAPSHTEIAAKMGMTQNAIKQAYHRFRCRYQSLLREEIAQTVAMPKDVEGELRHLISVFRA
jgi:RNA polymerase sigma factor (sigma-70 family)